MQLIHYGPYSNHLIWPELSQRVRQTRVSRCWEGAWLELGMEQPCRVKGLFDCGDAPSCEVGGTQGDKSLRFINFLLTVCIKLSLSGYFNNIFIPVSFKVKIPS